MPIERKKAVYVMNMYKNTWQLGILALLISIYGQAKIPKVQRKQKVPGISLFAAL